MDIEKILESRPLAATLTIVATIQAVEFLASPFLGGISVVAVLATCLVVLYAVGSKPNSGAYRISSIDASLVVQRSGGHHRYRYVRRQQIVALQNGTRLVEFQPRFTGRRTRRLRFAPVTDRQRVLTDGRADEDGRQHCWVHLDRPLLRGEEDTCGIRQVFEDDLEAMLPYFREGGGRHPVHDLRVTVRFSLAEDPGNDLEGLIWNHGHQPHQRHVAGTLPVTREVDTRCGTVDYTIAVHRPRRHHAYGVRWRWRDSGRLWPDPSSPELIQGSEPGGTG